MLTIVIHQSNPMVQEFRPVPYPSIHLFRIGLLAAINVRAKGGFDEYVGVVHDYCQVVAYPSHQGGQFSPTW